MKKFKFNVVLVLLCVCRTNASKYCSYEINGEPKYFICARNEYCCNFGCCVHLAFQFYQLWYYWLLLIFMFMICSGGSWWYKFCRQNSATNYPSMQSNYERPTRQGNIECRRIRSIESSNLDNSSIHLQRIWKGYGEASSSNNYMSPVVRYHNSSDLESRRQQQECSYYQLYGPPPSYESVVQMPESGNGQPSCMLITPAQPGAPVYINSGDTNENVSTNNQRTTPNTIQNPIPSTSDYAFGDSPISSPPESEALKSNQKIPICSASNNSARVSVFSNNLTANYHSCPASTNSTLQNQGNKQNSTSKQDV